MRAKAAGVSGTGLSLKMSAESGNMSAKSPVDHDRAAAKFS